MLQLCGKPLIQHVLIVAVGLLATVPTIGPCVDRGGRCRSMSCCGACSKQAGQTFGSCCSNRSAVQVCHCAKDERPVAPATRLSSAERSDLFRVAVAASPHLVGGDTGAIAIEGSVLQSLLPRSCQQAFFAAG